MAEIKELKSLLVKVKEEIEKAGLKLNIQKPRSWHPSMANRWGKNGNNDRLFTWAPKSLQMLTAAMKLKTLAPWKKCYDKLIQHIKKQRQYFANKGPYSQTYGFPRSHVWMWELDHKEGWASKNWCFWTVVLKKTLESPLDWKEIRPVNSKGNQSWLFIGRADAKIEAPVLWPPDAKSWLIRKKLWCWEKLKAGEEGGNGGWDG